MHRLKKDLLVFEIVNEVQEGQTIGIHNATKRVS